MSIFERFTSGKKPEDIIPGFESDPVLDSEAKKVADLFTQYQGYEMHRGEDEESAQAWRDVHQELTQTIDKGGDQLSDYIKPYMNIEGSPTTDSAEWQRWFAGVAIKKYTEGNLRVPD